MKITSIGCSLLLLQLLLLTPTQADIAVQGGKVLWKQSAGDSPMVAISVSAKGQYVAFIDQQFGEYIAGQASNVNRTLHFLNSEGTRIWSHTAPLFSGPLSVSAEGNFVCVGYGYGIALFDKMGMLVWNTTSPQSGYRNTISLSAEGDGRCQAITETFDEAAGRLIGHSFLQFNATGRLLSNRSLVGPFDYVRTAWVTNTGQYVVLSSGWSASSYVVLLFDRDGRLLWSHHPGGGSIDTVFVAKNASYVAGGTGENEVFLYNGKGELLWFHKQESPILKVTISPDEKTVIAGSRDGYLYYYSLDGQLLRKSQFAESYGTYPLSFSQDGSYVAAGVYENNANLYTIDGRQLWTQEASGPTGFGELWTPFVSFGGELTAWFKDNNIRLIDKNGELLWQRELDGSIDGLLVSSTGNYLIVRSGAVGSENSPYYSSCEPFPLYSGPRNKVSFFNKQGVNLWSYETSAPIYSMSISNDGEYVALGSDKLDLLDRGGRLLWSYAPGGCFRTLSQFSMAGEFAAGVSNMTSGFNRVYFFDGQGKPLWSHEMFTRAASMSPDGNLIAVGSYQGVYLFDRAGKQLWNHTLSSVLVEAISSTSDGSYVAALGMNTTYDPETGYYPLGPETLYFFDRQGKPLWRKESVGLPFSFSPDQGYALVSTGVFDKHGNQLWRPPAREYSYPVISSDGGYIAVASTEYKLFFTLMQSETSTSTFQTSIPIGPANIPTMFWNSLLIGVVIFASLASLAIFLLRKPGKPTNNTPRAKTASEES